MNIRNSHCWIFAGCLAAALAPSSASAAVGEWFRTTGVEIRLVGTPDTNGVLVAALEFRLDPGWKTYWRSPGPAGLPPVFNTTASWNLGAIHVGYPPPHRFNDGYSTTNVYEGRVILPITLIAGVAGAPVNLSIAADIGVCDVVCVPVHFDAGVIILPGRVDLEALALVNEGRALLPTGPVANQFEVTSFQLVGTTGRNVVVTATVLLPQAFGAELFVEGPTDWIAQEAVQVGRIGNLATFTFNLSRPGTEDPITGVPIRLTAVSAGQSIEQWIRLP